MLNDKNYFSEEADKHYMSVSLLKNILKCEASFKIKEFRECFLEGHFLEEALYKNGNVNKFIGDNPEICNQSGTLKAKYRTYLETAEFVKKDKQFVNSLQGENEKIFTGELFGVPWKIKVDCINLKKGFITDLKFIKDFRKVWSDKENKYVNFVELYRYDIQAAVYQEIVRQNTGKVLNFYIAAVTKEKIPKKSLLYFNKLDLKDALEYVESVFDRVKQVWKGEVAPNACGTCENCLKSHKIKNLTYWKEL